MADRHKVYVRGKYRSLRVFSKKLTDVVLLRDVFGGTYYRHGVGYVWVVGRRLEINHILDRVAEIHPEPEEVHDNELANSDTGVATGVAWEAGSQNQLGPKRGNERVRSKRDRGLVAASLPTWGSSGA